MIDRVPQLGARAAYVKQAIRDKLIEHKQYIATHGEDMPDDHRTGAGERSRRERGQLDGRGQRLDRGGTGSDVRMLC